MGYPVKQSTTAQPLLFWLIASSDHITGLTGKAGSVVVSLSKSGAAGGVPAGAITEVDATNLPGLYKIAGNATDNATLGPLGLYAKDAASDPYSDTFQVVAYDPQDAVRLGLTALPNANANGVGGVAVLDANSLLDVDVKRWLATAVTAATAGIPDVNTKNYNNQAAATDANNLPKVDVEDWKASVVNALISGRVDSNVQANAATLTFNLTGNITGNLSGSVGSVTGAVGSVTGAVGSVTGAVGSVTGNVGGNVVGTVASVNNIVAQTADVAGVPTALLDLAAGVETSLTLRQALRLLVAAEASKLSGAGTTTITIRNYGDTKNRITATVDTNGNRTGLAYDLS